jgi:hypothetical protein
VVVVDLNHLTITKVVTVVVNSLVMQEVHLETVYLEVNVEVVMVTLDKITQVEVQDFTEENQEVMITLEQVVDLLTMEETLVTM